ncbi:MAG TPA: nuclear transport factor 2 family protein [Candidatus Binatia bacterium]|nr:nuclear transport factor 2 family protein [Candidatus Binatia bacterium]
MTMKRVAGGLVLAGFCACGIAAAAGEAVEEPIRVVLSRQEQAWNRGDLEGYMQGYWKSPDLVFYSGGTVTRGWEATLERYRRRYKAEGKEMGRLDFTEDTIEMLGDDSAVGRGRWNLTLSDGKKLTGLYTVILKRLPEGWRIVHDHSSSE